MLGVITNGFLLDARTIESFNEAGLTDLQVSVDRVKPGAVTSKALEPLRPRLEALAARARFRVVLSAVVGAGARLSEVADVIRAAREHGFRPRILLVHGPDGQLALGQEDRLAFADAQRLIGWHWRDAFDYRTRLLQHGLAPFRCRAGSRYLYVDEGGLAHWCAQTMAAFGKPLASYDHDDLRRQFHTPKPCNAACTLGCARSCSSFDRWFAES
jgi:MoaA/NifB/PqqE/SkfB family radical SAM enzyme